MLAIIDTGVDVNVTNIKNQTALLLASFNGNVDAIDALLNTGADVNIVNANGDTCLLAAAFKGCSKETLQKIIDHGADVNARNVKNQTALILASLKGSEDVINVLLNAEADANIVDDNGDTCLLAAAFTGCSKETLQKIIDHGADVNAANVMNQSAFMLAAKKGNLDAVNVLLNSGADLNIADVEGNTCLHHAVTGECSKKTLQALVDKGANANARNVKNQTALIFGSCKGSEDAINVLLNAGADANIVGDNGHTCLLAAAFKGCSKETLQKIIDHGADVNARSVKNQTALILASFKGSEDAIYVLLNAEADANIVDDNGHTCLHAAARKGCSKETLQKIIDHGADVNATDIENQTALLLASHKGNVDAIDVLLNAGTDTKIVNTRGITCLHTAVLFVGCSKETVQNLIAHGADVNATGGSKNQSASILAADKRNLDAINVLLNSGADPNIQDILGCTCLQHAIFRNCGKETLQVIIDSNADVNTTDFENQCALFIACVRRSEDAVKVLLRAGADPSHIAVESGETCLHGAVLANCSKDILDALVAYGADVNAINDRHLTPLGVAIHMGNVDAIQVLHRVRSSTHNCIVRHERWKKEIMVRSKQNE